MDSIKILKETKEIGKFLFNNSYLSDIVFQIDSEIFYGHRLILAIKNEVFQKLFYGSIPFEEKCLDILDLSPKTFSKILNFIYTDDVSIENVEADILLELLYASKKYMMKELISKCVGKINSKYEVNIEPNFPLVLYLSSHLHPEIDKGNCHEGMQLNTRHVFASEMFMNACFEHIYDFISYLNTQNLEPKALIFEFLLQWGNRECEKEKISKNYENVLKILKNKKFEPLSYIEHFSVTDIIEIRRRKILDESRINDLLLKIFGMRNLGNVSTTLPYKRFLTITTLPNSKFLVQPSLFCRQLYIFGIKLSNSIIAANRVATITLIDNETLIFKLTVNAGNQVLLPDIAFYPSYICKIDINDDSHVELQWSANDIEVKNSANSRIEIIYYK